MTLAPLRYLVDLNRQVLPETTPPERAFRYIDISQVSSHGAIEIPSETLKFKDAPSRARRMATPGDTIVSTVRTYLRVIAPVPSTDEPLVFSTGFAVLHPRNGLEPRFLSYACRSDPFVEEIVARSVGVSYPAIAPTDLLDVTIPNPITEDQRRIADFLDDRVTRIDQIIAARQRQIGHAEALPWQALAEALADTAIVSLPLRRAIRWISDGPFGSAFSSADYADEGPAVIRLGNIGFATFRADDVARVPDEIYERFPRSHVEAGDLLIASLGDSRNHAGRACAAPEGLGRAMVKGKCYVARAEPAIASEDFLAMLLSSPAGAESLALQGEGATRTMLNFERLLSAALPMPTPPKQLALIREFENDRDQAYLQVGRLRSSVALLSEFKRSLITSAVSGKLDVSTAGSGIPG